MFQIKLSPFLTKVNTFLIFYPLVKRKLKKILCVISTVCFVNFLLLFNIIFYSKVFKLMVMFLFFVFVFFFLGGGGYSSTGYGSCHEINHNWSSNIYCTTNFHRKFASTI